MTVEAHDIAEWLDELRNKRRDYEESTWRSGNGNKLMRLGLYITGMNSDNSLFEVVQETFDKSGNSTKENLYIGNNIHEACYTYNAAEKKYEDDE